MLDAEYAVDWAREIRAGDFWGSPEGTAYFRTPLYAWFLAAAFSMPGDDLLGARLLQALLASLAGVLLADVSARRFGRTAAWSTGILTATAWPLLLFGRELLIVSVAFFLVAWLLWLVDRSRPGDPPWRWLLLGVVTGLGALARPNLLALLPVVVGVAFLAGPARRLLRTALVLAGCALIVLPIGARNQRVSGDFVLLSYQGGLNLWIGNNPEADGLSAVLPGFSSWRNEDVEAHLRRETGRPVGPREQDAYFRKLALDFFRTSPGAAIGGLLRKTYFFLQGYEIRNNRDLYFQRDRIRWMGFPLPDFGWIVPLALVGWWAHRRRWRELLPHVAFAALVGATVVLFFVCSRYRIPAWPPLLVLAGAGVASVLEPSPLRARILHLVAIVALAVLARVDFLDVREPDPSQPHFQVGNVYARIGDHAEAEREYRTALSLSPGFAEARYHLGALFLLQGRVPEAISELRAAAAGLPRSFRARRSLAEALERAGATGEAVAVRREAVELSGGHPEDRLALATALAADGRTGEAIALFDELESAGLADDPYFQLNAGQAALDVGQVERGTELLRRASEDPRTRVDAIYSLGRYLLSVNRVPAALDWLDRGIARAPGEAGLHRLRAFARHTAGDREGAIADLEAVTRLDPADRDSRRRLEELRGASE